MPLPPGARLGVYEIVRPIGAGGMGEVYRARDTRLGRDVAIKVLPASVALDADRLARFEREARVLASVNHPNIASIYGIEQASDQSALVLELVEGETLDTRLRAHASGMSVAEVVAIGRQLVDALDAAHEKGIVHRDLKPANIILTPDRVVKVLDFGLAKAESADQPASGALLTNSPTLLATTREGVILGTAAYMSPEQARGRVVDKRTDIWAFGCVIWELLTGRPAFRGDTVSDLIAAILQTDPDWGLLPRDTPLGLRRALERCLEKDVRKRLRDIADIRTDLDDRQDTARSAVRLHASRRALWIAAGLALAAVGFASWRVWTAPAVADRPDVQLHRLTDIVGMEESPAISPDGKTVAYVASSAGRRQIWVRLLAGGSPLQITHDPVDHDQPRWTRDSSALVYYTQDAAPPGTLWEISALGGAPRRLGPALSGGDVSHDGRRVAAFQFEDEHLQLVAFARDGSGATRLAQLPFPASYSSPRWSPDDRLIAFEQRDTANFDVRLLVVDLGGGGAPRTIARADYLRSLAWRPDGAGLVYSSSAGSTVLYPPTFQLRAVNADGTNDRQLTFGDVSYVEPDVDAQGRIVASHIRSQSDIWQIQTGGTPADNTRGARRVTLQTGAAQAPSLNPDGTEIVYLSDSGGHGNLWVVGTDGANRRQITFEQDQNVSIGVPVWSPAGDWIVFIVTRRGTTGLSLIKPDGSGVRSLVASGTWAAWSADGRWLYYQPARPGPMAIEKVAVDGGPAVVVRTDDAGAPAPARADTLYFLGATQGQFGAWGDWEVRRASPEGGPARTLGRMAPTAIPVSPFLAHMFLSPDERLLAFPLTDGATSNIWVQPTDGGAMRPLTDFGSRPVLIARRVSWAPDGKSLYAAVAETDADIVMLEGLAP